MVLKLRIKSTYVDQHYAGLNGIQLFGLEDKPIQIPPNAISAFPTYINSLSGVHGDRRTISNLIDGSNWYVCGQRIVQS